MSVAEEITQLRRITDDIDEAESNGARLTHHGELHRRYLELLERDGESLDPRQRRKIRQLFDRAGTEAGPGLRDAPGGRHRPRVFPAPPRGQRLAQADHHFLVIVLGEQRQRHREIHHHVRRHLAARTLGRPAPRRDRGVHHLAGHRRRQHPQRNQIRQGPCRRPTSNTNIISTSHRRTVATRPGPHRTPRRARPQLTMINSS